MKKPIEVKTEPRPIRELMPDGFINMIAQETGAWAPTISEAVTNERTNSGIWPEIEKLAMATDPEACKARLAFLAEKRAARRNNKAA